MLRYQYVLKQMWSKKIDSSELPKNTSLSFNHKFLLNSNPLKFSSTKKNLHSVIVVNWFGIPKTLHTMTSHRINISPLPTLLEGEIKPHKKSHTSFLRFTTCVSASEMQRNTRLTTCVYNTRKTPSCVTKFVNHLMISGKKGVAVGLFAAALHLFLKRLQGKKGLDDLRKISLPFNEAALCFLQRPGKNILGLSFSFPSKVVNNNRVPCVSASEMQRNTSCQHPCASMMSPRFAVNCQESLSESLSVKKYSIISDDSMASGGHRNSSLSLLSCLELAVGNVEPNLEVRKKKIAGITRQIPCIVPKPRGQGLAIRWIISAAQERKRKEGQSFPKSLAEELVNAYYQKGEPRQKRDSLHKLAESNRSFLRYRWW